MTHRTFSRRGKSREGASIEDLRGTAVDDRFIEAAKAVSEAFRKAGVRHTLVGGLAVGVRGYPRYTKDIDFLVGDEAFDHSGLIVSPKAGLPIRYGTIDVDWVSMTDGERAEFERYLETPTEGEVPVIESPALVLMKLIAGRQRDLADVVELIKAGIDVDATRSLVTSMRPPLLRQLDDLIEKAESE